MFSFTFMLIIVFTKIASAASSETQGQILGARESKTGRKKKKNASEDFPSPRLSAPGCPRMIQSMLSQQQGPYLINVCFAVV